jgi:putative MFS transporter
MFKQSDFKLLFSVPVIVAALGYFVDIYDLLLFGIVRTSSLQALGIPQDQLLTKGEYLIQMQMGGLLLGGIIWGVMGDKRGRLSVLFGSILLYSLANIGNGFVTNVTQYAILRFIAGLGLAGELGAGITLVSEILPTRLRGYGTALVASIGLFGAVVANFVSQLGWQTAYFIGGGLGLLLLIARISVFESGIFLNMKGSDVDRGNLLQLVGNGQRLKKFLGCIFIGCPIWFVIGNLVLFSPEIARSMGMTEAIIAGNAVMWSYIGLVFGDLTSGFGSQLIKSRKKMVLIFIALDFIFVCIYLFVPVATSFAFYAKCFMLGFGIGYWALFVTIAAEQFGTNLRSTVATTVPNLIRGTLIPITWLFQYLRGRFDMINGALIVIIVTTAIALIALSVVDETYSRELNFVEKD